jgi:hypothetical protein
VSFKRLNRVVHLVVVLPDGSPGTIRADATDVLGQPVPSEGGTVFDTDGLRRLCELVTVLRPAARRHGQARKGK